MPKNFSLLLAKSVAMIREQGVLSSAFIALDETIPDFSRKCKRDTLPLSSPSYKFFFEN